MTLSTNSLSTDFILSFLVFAMVFILPWADRRLCRRLGLSLTGVSANPDADRLLTLRRYALWAAFSLYALIVAWLVFLSRSMAGEHQVHIAVFRDLQSSIRSDLSLSAFFRLLFTEGIDSALSHVHVVSAADIHQVYLNVILFVPMGYLLPYVFDWFRARCRVRPVAACFLISLLIENIQLIGKRGFYDIDDLICNTLGGLLGQWLFLSVAYVVTHPEWRKDLSYYRRWKRNARRRTLYPFARRIRLSRITLLATDETAVYDFYIMKLGFRLLRQLVPEDSARTDFLLEMGNTQLEIRCSNAHEALPTQYLTIAVTRLMPVRRRLEQNGILPGPYEQDPYTGQRQLCFDGPDGVRIRVMER